MVLQQIELLYAVAVKALFLCGDPVVDRLQHGVRVAGILQTDKQDLLRVHIRERPKQVHAVVIRGIEPVKPTENRIVALLHGVHHNHVRNGLTDLLKGRFADAVL